MIEDIRLNPNNAHPLNASDVVRSNVRIADIEVGLTSEDAIYWKDKARNRVRALEDDAAMFGLAPHEEAELEQLKSMLAQPNERLAG